MVSITVFTLFISSIIFFKGDPSWGPQYFTPVFALLWIFTPACSTLLSRRLTAGFLVLGFVVQLGALASIPIASTSNSRCLGLLRLVSGTLFSPRDLAPAQPASGGRRSDCRVGYPGRLLYARTEPDICLSCTRFRGKGAGGGSEVSHPEFISTLVGEHEIPWTGRVVPLISRER